MTAFILALGAFCAGLLKVGFGQGAGVLALPVCSLVVPVRFANGVLAPLLTLGDTVSFPAYWRQWDTRLLRVFLPGQITGTAIGAWALAHMSEAAARRSIGGLLLMVAAFQVWARASAVASARNPSVAAGGPGAADGPGAAAAAGALAAPANAHPLTAFLVSLITGFTSALAQLGSGFLSLYLIRLRTAKSAIVPTLNITFFFSNLLKIALYWRYGLISKATWTADAWLAPALLAGGIAGVAANRRLSQRTFENALLAFALVSGAKLLLW